jgi:ATP-dependent RNA helicase DDX49/DBP8
VKHVVIATPGRLAGHLNTVPSFNLAQVRFLVMDEADRLLTATFQPDLETIMHALPPPSRRQTLLFSATMTSDIAFVENMASEKEEPFVRYDACQVGGTTVSTLRQEYLFMPIQARHCYLVYLLRKYDTQSAIVFCATCRSAELLHQVFAELEIESVPLHSMMAQSMRLRSLNMFKSSRARVLVATDVASRGLDIPQVGIRCGVVCGVGEVKRRNRWRGRRGSGYLREERF